MLSISLLFERKQFKNFGDPGKIGKAFVDSIKKETNPRKKQLKLNAMLNNQKRRLEMPTSL